MKLRRKAVRPPSRKPVLLWRPGGRNENQRGENRRPGNRGQGREQTAREQGERKRGEGRRDNRDGANRDAANRGGEGERKRDGGRPIAATTTPIMIVMIVASARTGRNAATVAESRKGQQRFEAKPPRKEKPLDPDSPFAKLAALKEQLKK